MFVLLIIEKRLSGQRICTDNSHHSVLRGALNSSVQFQMPKNVRKS